MFNMSRAQLASPAETYAFKHVRSIGAAILAIGAVAAFPGAAAAETNVALGSTVTLDGPDFGNSHGWFDWNHPGPARLAAPSTVVDGSFLQDGARWNVDTVFWGSTGSNSIVVTLPKAAKVDGLVLQADNNDDYGIQYRDLGGTWHDLTVISPARGWGLATASASGFSVDASAFSIKAVGGDGLRAVSEFQAFGSPISAPVPEPATYGLMAAGLGLLGVVGTRRARALTSL